MSKLTKFINHPRWFFKDAFKKQEENIAVKIDNLNNHLNRVGIPSKLDIHSLEHKFINAAVRVAHHNLLSQQVIKLIIRSQGLNQSSDFPVLNQLNQVRQRLNQNIPHLLIKHSFEISINPNNRETEEVLISPEVNQAQHAEQIGAIKNQVSEINYSIPSNWSARTKQFHKRLR
jgi:hypothetical protein